MPIEAALTRRDEYHHGEEEPDMAVQKVAVQKMKANGLGLAYEQIGRPGDTPVLAIMGFGCQMVSWPDAFCGQFADRGFHLTRFDNRDIGLSTHLTEAGTPEIGAVMSADAW